MRFDIEIEIAQTVVTKTKSPSINDTCKLPWILKITSMATGMKLNNDRIDLFLSKFKKNKYILFIANIINIGIRETTKYMPTVFMLRFVR